VDQDVDDKLQVDNPQDQMVQLEEGIHQMGNHRTENHRTGNHRKGNHRTGNRRSENHQKEEEIRQMANHRKEETHQTENLPLRTRRPRRSQIASTGDVRHLERDSGEPAPQLARAQRGTQVQRRIARGASQSDASSAKGDEKV